LDVHTTRRPNIKISLDPVKGSFGMTLCLWLISTEGDDRRLDRAAAWLLLQPIPVPAAYGSAPLTAAARHIKRPDRYLAQALRPCDFEAMTAIRRLKDDRRCALARLVPFDRPRANNCNASCAQQRAGVR
jgi:hypothetical protein